MPKIEDYALLGDLHTAALASATGSIDWLCLPRFDSPAAFAALLDHDRAGHWTLAPAADGRCTTRRYAGNTLVLETDWVAADGAVRVIDFMPHRADTPHVVRIAVGLDGRVAMRSALRLRFDYGREVPWVRRVGSEVHAIAGPNLVRLTSAVPLRGKHTETLADFTVRKGDRVPFRHVVGAQLPAGDAVRRRRTGPVRDDGLLDRVVFSRRVPDRTVSRRGRPVAHHPEGPDLPADRRDRRGREHVAAGGETLDALFLARQVGLPADPDAWALQVALMNYLESAWREPDNGLWEVRGDRQHFTHSKVMCWVAADRMARSVRAYGLPGPAERWELLRDQIHHDVVTRGFDARRNTFTQVYGSAALDASLLLIPRAGFLPATDPRVLGTIAAVRRELSEGDLVRRYQTSETDDGVKGSEGLFIACSFWLVDALYASGQCRDAVDLFERLLLLRNDVGLLSEEWDPVARRQLGNTPQAFSHFALVISALQLHTGHMVRSDNPMMT